LGQSSYKKLPVVVYQIGTKFRDELRPRGGVIRAREFLMKDAYSFCENNEDMKEIYENMRLAYERIFSRCGLNYRVVEAESGPIGGEVSHEFLAYTPAGEDKMVECEGCGYSAKIEKAVSFALKELYLTPEEEVFEKLGIEVGFVGPSGIEGKIPLVVDKAVLQGRNFVAGANKKDTHFLNVNPGRDFTPSIVGDIRFVLEGEKCPFCNSSLRVKRGLEVGHLFNLGYRYSSSLGAFFLDRVGKKKPLLMGCYGIGVSRLPAAVVEQNHDENGIIWPREIAPFKVVIIPTSGETLDFSEKLYFDLRKNAIDVLWDDRDVSPGVKFKDSDLIGIPLKIIIGNTFLKEGKVEIKKRRDGEIIKVKKEEIIQKLTELN